MWCDGLALVLDAAKRGNISRHSLLNSRHSSFKRVWRNQQISIFYVIRYDNARVGCRGGDRYVEGDILTFG